MSTPAFTNNRVLWVDDRPNNNVRERALMTELGLVVQIVVSTGQALQYLRERRYGAIISDMARQHQGSKEGYVLLRQIRADGIRTPYFIYAGSASPAHLEQVLEAGGDGCTNESHALVRMVTQACSTTPTRSKVGLVIETGRSLPVELRRELKAHAIDVEVVRDPSGGQAPGDAVEAWIVAGRAIDTFRSPAEASGSPMVLLPDSDERAQDALKTARPQDEVCSPAEAPAMQVQRVLRCLRLRQAARLDTSTGLLHRRAFEADFEQWQAQVSEHMHVRALFVLDIDNFKLINDHHGHHAGDQVLKQVADRLRGLAGAQSLARFGGEEFAWLAQADSLTGLADLAERAVDAMRDRLFRLDDGSELRVTACAGWALVVPEDGGQAIHRADQALYHAKGHGRDRAVAHHHMAEGPSASDADVELLHFQNVAKVVMERSTRLVSLVGKDMIERARRLADRDPLTGAWNRGYLDRRLARELELARRNGRPLTVALMDLDHFGQFNKNHGAPTGDAVLRKFMRVAEESLRATDWLARYGGEEFLLVVPGPPDEAAVVAERLRASVAETDVHRPAVGGTVRVTVSIGIAAFDAATMANADALIQGASEALQAAKRAGRDRVVVAGARPAD